MLIQAWCLWFHLYLVSTFLCEIHSSFVSIDVFGLSTSPCVLRSSVQPTVEWIHKESGQGVPSMCSFIAATDKIIQTHFSNWTNAGYLCGVVAMGGVQPVFQWTFNEQQMLSDGEELCNGSDCIWISSFNGSTARLSQLQTGDIVSCTVDHKKSCEADSSLLESSEDPNSRWHHLDRLSIATSSHSECYGNGWTYSGRVQQTIGNLTCIPWNSLCSIDHIEEWTNTPLEENFCRSSVVSQRPSCFVDLLQTVTFQACLVPLCVETPPSVPVWHQEYLLIIPAVLMVIIILIIGFRYRLLSSVRPKWFQIISATPEINRNADRSQRLNVSDSRICGTQSFSALSVDLSEGLVLNPSYYSLPSAGNSSSPELAILHCVSLLGVGCSASVYLAKWSPSGNQTVDVAAKILRPDCSERDRLNLDEEVKILGRLSHPNVVKLLGLTTVGCQFCLVLELSPLGDLRSFLISNSRDLSEATLRRFSLDVATGMTYLSSLAIVHRDLAARNLLLSVNEEEEFVVKISDFGLAKPLVDGIFQSSDPSDRCHIPIRWTSPESIAEGIFSVNSDVWSFGVVLWEIFSFGIQPYFGKSNEEVVRYVESGGMLSRPDGCDAHLYGLMTSCCQPTSSSRPHFDWLRNQLAIPVDPLVVNIHSIPSEL